jgi:hypothetical protein
MRRGNRRSSRTGGRQIGRTPSQQPKTRGRSQKSRGPSARQMGQRERSFNALNLYRSGKAKSATAAARMARTTLRAMRKSVPGAFVSDRHRHVRIKPSDRYSAKVQILTHEGAIATTARGSRQRELAGQHRATFMRVLRGLEPKSALERYRGRKVGGHELVSDYAELVTLAKAGVVGHLEPLYVGPDVAA